MTSCKQQSPQSDKYKKDFDTVVTFLIWHINKRAPTLSVKVASLSHTKPAKQQKTSANHGTFKGKAELKKYSIEEYDSMSIVQCQQLYELQQKAGHAKGKKTPESRRALEEVPW